MEAEDYIETKNVCNNVREQGRMECLSGDKRRRATGFAGGQATIKTTTVTFGDKINRLNEEDIEFMQIKTSNADHLLQTA